MDGGKGLDGKRKARLRTMPDKIKCSGDERLCFELCQRLPAQRLGSASGATLSQLSARARFPGWPQKPLVGLPQAQRLPVQLACRQCMAAEGQEEKPELKCAW